MAVVNNLRRSYHACRNADELEALLDQPDATSAVFLEALYEEREEYRRSDASDAVKQAFELRLVTYCHLIGRRLVSAPDGRDAAALLTTPRRERRDRDVVIAEQWDLRGPALGAVSRIDTRREVARLVANIVATSAGDDDRPLLVADRIAAAMTENHFAAILDLVRNDPVEARTLVGLIAERVLSREWAALLLLGESVAALRFISCAACSARYCFDFWIVIGENDADRRRAFASGTLNRPECPHCKSGAGERNGCVTVGIGAGATISDLTWRMTACATQFGFVVRVPEMGDLVENRVVLQVVAEPLFRIKPHRLERLTNYFVDSSEESAEILDTSRLADSPANDAFNRFYFAFLKPLIRSLRSGEMTYEEAEAAVAKKVTAQPLFGPRGTLASRELESPDADAAFMMALIAKTNEVTGHAEAAAMGFLEAAAQAQLTGRGAAVLLFLKRAETLFDDPSIAEDMRLAGRGQLHLVRASQLAGMGEKGAEAEFRLAVDFNRRRLAASSGALTRDMSAPTILNLASALSSVGHHLSPRDFREAVESFREAIELCDEVEGWPAGECDDDVLSSIRATRNITLTRAGRLYRHCKSFIHAVGWWLDAPATEEQRPAGRAILDKLGIGADLLKSNLEFMAGEFPEFWRIDPVTGGGGFRAGLFAAIDARERKAFLEAYDLAVRHGFDRVASHHAAEVAVAYLEEDQREALRYGALAEKHARAGGEPLALAGALTAYAAVLLQGDGSGEALPKLREAHEIYMSARRHLALDEQRISFGAATAGVAQLIGAALRDALATEWISTLETMKAGALTDAFVRPPLRLTELGDHAGLRRMDEIGKTVAEIRGRIVSLETPAEYLWPLQAGLMFFSEKQAELRDALMQLHPRYSEALADVVSSFPLADALFDAARERHGQPAVMMGLWVDYDDVLVYGWRPGGEPFRMRIPLLVTLREASGTRWVSVAQFAGAYRSALYQCVQRPEREEAFRAGFAAPLYRTLWKEIARELGAAPEIVISPHAELHSIPWATLWDGERYLAASTAFTTVFTFGATAYAPSASGRAHRILLLADPDLGDERAPLPGARLEAQMIGAVAEEAGVDLVSLLGPDANRTRLRDESERCDAIHFACHADFDPDEPERSSLLLSGTQAGVPAADRLRLQQIAEELDLHHVSLVTLSACETGRATSRGDEVLGLTRGFSSAGVRNVVSTLWRVRDDDAALLMATFYSYLLHQDDPWSPRMALAAAQRDMLSAGGVTSNPAAWGAFVHYSV